jgi:drug/metabolite transporter (DMT)-like permease
MLLSARGLGVLAGLSTAILWTATALCFEASSRRLGSLAVNVLRLVLAVLLFTALSLLRTRLPWPASLSSDAWLYLGLSGLVGFVIGDVLLFQAFVLIGARLAMLIYASVPLLTALGGFLFLGERMKAGALLGMAMTVAGIGIAVASKPAQSAERQPSHRTAGILMAVGGAAGQAAGLLLGKRGAIGLDSFKATQIRALFGLAGFLLLALLLRQLRGILALVGEAIAPTPRIEQLDSLQLRSVRSALLILSVGALLGPFLGVSLGLLSAQLLPTGIASTLMAMVPILLIPVSAVVLKERVSVVEVVGALLAVAGVAVLAS